MGKKIKIKNRIIYIIKKKSMWKLTLGYDNRKQEKKNEKNEK